MANLTYVTGNYGKYISVKEHFAEKQVDLEFLEYDFEEPEINDIERISKQKALEAYKILGTPCFVADTGFYIDNYPNNPGYPGAFVKRSGVANDIDSLLEAMKNVQNRTCRFLDCLTFYDGREFYTFYGISEGTLSLSKRGNDIRKAKSNLWCVFIPKNCDKTLAEMSDEERKDRNDDHTSATDIFAEWYKSEYLSFKKLIKK